MQRLDDYAKLRVQIGQISGFGEVDLVDKLSCRLLSCPPDRPIAHVICFDGEGVWIEITFRKQALYIGWGKINPVSNVLLEVARYKNAT